MSSLSLRLSVSITFLLFPQTIHLLKYLSTILSLLLPSSRVGILLRKTPSTLHPIDFIAAILLALILSALSSKRSIPICSKQRKEAGICYACSNLFPGIFSHTTYSLIAESANHFEYRKTWCFLHTSLCVYQKL